MQREKVRDRYANGVAILNSFEFNFFFFQGSELITSHLYLNILKNKFQKNKNKANVTKILVHLHD